MFPFSRANISCVVVSPAGCAYACLAVRFLFARGELSCYPCVSKQKPTQKGNIAMSCNCQKCLYEDKPTTDSTAHSVGGDHATFDTRKLVAGTFVEIGARRFFKIGDPDVWVTRDGEHLTCEEFARVVQNTTTPVIVNPAEVRWYERP